MKRKIECKSCGVKTLDSSSSCPACGSDLESDQTPGPTRRGRFHLAKVFSRFREKYVPTRSTPAIDYSRETNGDGDSRASSKLVNGFQSPKEDAIRNPNTDSDEAVDIEEETVEAHGGTSKREDTGEASDAVEEGRAEKEARIRGMDSMLSGYIGPDEPETPRFAGGALRVVPIALSSGPIARVKTYVDGFDDALDGGIPEKNIVLISGDAGAMKSSLAFYILYMNILASGTKCLFITLEQTLRSLLNQMNALGMDHEAVKNSLRVFDLGHIRKHLGESKEDWFKIFMDNICHIQRTMGFDLVAIDSLEALEVIADFQNRRADLFQLFEWLREMNITTFLVTERSDCPFGRHLSHFRNDEMFLSDGIINLALHPINEIDVQRRIRCIKMRGTRHEPGYFSLVWDDGRFKVTKAVSR